METAGFDSDVAKIMPPLNIPIETLREGLDLLRDAAGEVLAAVGVDTDPRPAA
jgi:4-aminobutyrate aminotransferase-like enzyme